jgi:hypothetical protein
MFYDCSGCNTMGTHARRTPTRDFHETFIFRTFDFVINLCRQQTKSHEIMTMQMFATLDKAKFTTRSIGVFNLGGGQAAVVALGRYRAWSEMGGHAFIVYCA